MTDNSTESAPVDLAAAPPADSRPRTVADFDRARREQADAAGVPVLRMTGRVAALTPTTFLMMRGGTLHRLDRDGRHAGVPRRFTPDDAMELFQPVAPAGSVGGFDGVSVWAANRAAAARASALAGSITSTHNGPGPDPVAGMRRTLDHLLTAEHAARLVITPDLLARKYHPTTALAGGSLRGWGAALGVTPASRTDPLAFFEALAEPLVSGENYLIGSEGPLKVIRASEGAVMANAQWGGIGFPATQLSAAEAADVAWRAMERVDPLLTERNIAGGECAVGIPDPLTPTLVRVDGRARLRVGDTLLITRVCGAALRDVRQGLARLSGYRMVAGALHAQLEAAPSSRRNSSLADTSGVGVLMSAAKDTAPVELSDRPYLRPAKKAYFGRQWSRRSVPPDRRVTRDVPLDVLLAGG